MPSYESLFYVKSLKQTLVVLIKAFWILFCFNLFLVFSFVFRVQVDFNQMNDNLNEKSIQNALVLIL